MKKTSIWGSLCIVLCIAILFTGCSNDAVKASQPMREITDSYNTVMKVPIKPQRIVSLTLGTDEVLIDLVEPERIVAVSKNAVDPEISSIVEKAQNIPVKIADRSNIESLIALKPDLVLMSDGFSLESVESLRDMGIAVFIVKSPSTIQDVKGRVLAIAQAVGEEEKGLAMVKRMEEKLNTIATKLSKIKEGEYKTVVAFSFSGAFGRKNGLFHDLCVHAKVINGVGDIGLKKGETVSKEQVVRINPDIFLLPTWNFDHQKVDGYRDELYHDPAYQTVKAVKNNRLEYVSDRYRYCISQYVADSVEQIAKVVYPECFSK